MKKHAKKVTAKKAVSKKTVVRAHKSVKAPKSELAFSLAAILAGSAVFMLLMTIYKYMLMA